MPAFNGVTSDGDDVTWSAGGPGGLTVAAVAVAPPGGGWLGFYRRNDSDKYQRPRAVITSIIYLLLLITARDCA